MHLDVVKLRAFYYRTKLGRIVQRALREEVVKLWPDVKGQTVAGFGFAAPMLRPFLADARRVMCFMPGPQGVMAWPIGKENHSILIDEMNWPISTGFIDKLVVLHGLEVSDNSAALLDEIWRVLGPGGRVLFIVPNRSGLWARSDGTPFGFGSPYSMAQLETRLMSHRFLPEKHIAALYAIPSHTHFGLKVAQMLEGFSLKISMPFAAGVVMVEATKQVHAPTQSGLSVAVRRPLGVLEGIRASAGKPVSGRTKG